MKSKSMYQPMSLSASAVLALVLGTVPGLGGCQQEGPAEKAGAKIDRAAESAGNKLEGAKETMGEKAEKAGDYLDDAALTAKIKAEILADPALKVLQINVTTTNGVVNLSGAVDSQQSIDKAMALARGNRNVKSVENGLVVKGVK